MCLQNDNTNWHFANVIWIYNTTAECVSINFMFKNINVMFKNINVKSKIINLVRGDFGFTI